MTCPPPCFTTGIKFSSDCMDLNVWWLNLDHGNDLLSISRLLMDAVTKMISGLFVQVYQNYSDIYLMWTCELILTSHQCT